jgi:hypothetical protein
VPTSLFLLCYFIRQAHATGLLGLKKLAMSTDILHRNSTKVHQLHNHVSLEWVDGCIAFFTLTASVKDALDIYIDVNIQIINNAKSGQWLLSMHDISHPNVTLNPYFRARLNEVAEMIRDDDKIHRSGIILANNIMGRVFSVFGNLFSSRAYNTEQRYFNSRDRALSWLRTFKDQTTSV